MEQVADKLVEMIASEIKKNVFIEVEASGRHVHLSSSDLNKLFGKDYELTHAKDLSQPGQFACKERVTITGPKGSIENVIILGPVRKETQIEISLTDAVVLGIKAPIKQSGNIENTPGCIISVNSKSIEKDKGVIIAKRHIHMTPEDADKFKVTDNEIVKIKVFGERPLIFDDIVVRVRDDFKTYVHIDYDEANACGYNKGMLAMILK